jgi:hypothetical protein
METGHLVSKTSVEHVTRDDYLKPEIKDQIISFTDRLNEWLNDANFLLVLIDVDEIDDLVNGNPGIAREEITTPWLEEYGDMVIDERLEDDDDDAMDKYLNCELIMDIGTNNERRGRVIKRARGLDGEPIGRPHANPLFDTREYEIEFTNGMVKKYAANIIVENMNAQVDDKGHQFLLLDEIVDHKKDGSAIPISEGMIQNASGTEKPKSMTKWWKLLVKFKDVSLDWVSLRDINDSNPLEVAEYAVENH